MPETRRATERATDCGAIAGRSWIVIAAEYQAEGLVTAECQKAGVQTFAPLVRIAVPQHNRPAIRREVYAFPGYVFALVNLDRWHGLRRMRGVASVLLRIGSAPEPAIVPDDVMGALLSRASIRGVLEGDSVRDVDPAPKRRSWLNLAEMDSDERRALLLEALGLAPPCKS